MKTSKFVKKYNLKDVEDVMITLQIDYDELSRYLRRNEWIYQCFLRDRWLGHPSMIEQDLMKNRPDIDWPNKSKKGSSIDFFFTQEGFDMLIENYRSGYERLM